MANFNKFQRCPGDQNGCFIQCQAPHSAGFPEDEASISGGFFLWNKNPGYTENRVSYPKRKIHAKILHGWLETTRIILDFKPPFILRRTQYNMHCITDFYCQMRISTSNGWDLPQSLFVSDLDSSQCDPTNAGRNCVFSRLWKATKGCADIYSSNYVMYVCRA